MTGIETGTGLGGVEVVVTDDLCIGEGLLEEGEDFVEGEELLGGAVVFVFVLGGLGVAAFVTYADAVGVMAFDVTSCYPQRTTVVDGAVSPDVDVIAGPGAEATTSVIGLEHLEGIALVGTGVSAMHDEGVDASGGGVTP